MKTKKSPRVTGMILLRTGVRLLALTATQTGQ